MNWAYAKSNNPLWNIPKQVKFYGRRLLKLVDGKTREHNERLKDDGNVLESCDRARFGSVCLIDSSAHSDAAPWDGDEHFRILAHPGQILMWVSRADGRFEFVSPSWLVFTGRAPADELGRGWRTHIHPDDVQAVEERFDHALKERSGFRLKYRYLREDGVYCWFVNEGMARQDAGGNFAGHVGRVST